MKTSFKSTTPHAEKMQIWKAWEAAGYKRFDIQLGVCNFWSTSGNFPGTPPASSAAYRINPNARLPIAPITIKELLHEARN